jgi:hypothetical protein
LDDQKFGRYLCNFDINRNDPIHRDAFAASINVKIRVDVLMPKLEVPFPKMDVFFARDIDIFGFFHCARYRHIWTFSLGEISTDLDFFVALDVDGLGYNAVAVVKP